MIDFQTHPDRYRHWKLRIEAPIAYLTMDVDPEATLRPGYELKMNSYDLGLYDAVQRLRFEHPEVRAVVLDSAKERIFCAGANIRMLGGSSHGHKVNFCKFTNETRNGIEDASACSGQRYLSAVNGAGGGYELALATDHSVATWPTSSVRLRRASRVSAPSTGAWSTRSPRPRSSPTRCALAPRRWPRTRTVQPTRRVSSCHRCSASSTTTASATRTSKWRSTVMRAARR
jgi:benzoyl-CoA-dihydrodiol lyase